MKQKCMKIPYLVAVNVGLAVILTFLACGGSGKQEAVQETPGEFVTNSSQADGIQRMHDYHFTEEHRMAGHVYAYTIDRVPSDTLPQVLDDEGVRYADNLYTLTIQRDGRPFFSRRFTKASFASYLSQEFRKKGLLDGMMFDKSLPGLNFAISVSLPQSDMIEPLLLHVDNAGGISIERDTRSENDFEEEQ